MRKKGVWIMFLLALVMHHSHFIVKTVLGFCASEVVSNLVVDPLLNRYSSPERKVPADINPREFNQYVELQVLKLLRILETQPCDLPECNLARQQLCDFAHHYTGLFIEALKEYFCSEEEMKLFLQKHSIVIPHQNI